MLDKSSDESVSASASASERTSRTVCYLCRQRKTKCDRALPRCGFCVKAKVSCQYVAKPKKRGLRAGYVSELESRLEALEEEVRSLKDGERTTPANPTRDSISLWSPGVAETSTGTNQTLAQSPLVNTPALSSSSSTRNDTHIRSEDAVKDLISLPREYMYNLADLFFKETYLWMPILSRQHVQKALEALPSPMTHIDDVVLRAVISLQIAYSSQAICLGYHGRYRLSQYLRGQVLNEALSKASLSSLQALLVIAILDCGTDNIDSTFSLLSVCRRMCENIGLFRKLLDLMADQNPAQVGPPAAGNHSGETPPIALTWVTLAIDAVSTLGVSWRDVSAALVDHLSSIAYVSTPDLKDSFRSHAHLAAIGLQPLHTFIYEHERGRYENREQEALSTCDEIYKNLTGYVSAHPNTSYTLLADGLIDFDPNLTHTSILSPAAIIILYQRVLKLGGPAGGGIPLERCLQACEDLVVTLRNISDVDAELNTPFLSLFLFVAARLKLILYRHLEQAREPMFDTLMHGLNMCGRRWPLARRMDIVLRAAIVEVDTGTPSSLPQAFWDLKKSHHDISEALKDWVNSYKDPLYVGSLHGPFFR
ncbi:hypothetical protein B0A52_08395 [Exophiala mesophila]|uniref:Zn(2)-C6 fungal-type domain-containing protein n=1 Tax=Exophiala mesophila TaxID=212818 RepID=A0A438MYG9_EXOME|nr:hypothetical protein B0A52_08395 [Exophiala mesophila]